MKKSKYFALLLTVIFCAALLTGCVPGDGANGPGHLAGFFSGVWHGWIAPISLIIRFFDDSRSIYEVYNNGFMYDLGFYMAVISGFCGLSLSRKKKND